MNELIHHDRLNEAKQAACRVSLSVLSYLQSQDIGAGAAAVLLKIASQADGSMKATDLEEELSLSPTFLDALQDMNLISLEGPNHWMAKLTPSGELTVAGIIGAALIP